MIRRAAGAVGYDKHSCHSSRPKLYLHIMGALIAAIICKGEDSRNRFQSESADQPDKSPAPIFHHAARVISVLASPFTGADWTRCGVF